MENSLASPRPYLSQSLHLCLVALQGSSFQSLCGDRHSSNYFRRLLLWTHHTPSLCLERSPWKRLWLVEATSTPRWPRTVSMLAGSRFAVHIFIAYSVRGLIPRFVSAEGYFSTSMSLPTPLSEKHPVQPHSYLPAPRFHSHPKAGSLYPLLSLGFLWASNQLLCLWFGVWLRRGPPSQTVPGSAHHGWWLRSGGLPQLLSAPDLSGVQYLCHVHLSFGPRVFNQPCDFSCQGNNV